jgi:CBS-domain-containing membrane protein
MLRDYFNKMQGVTKSPPAINLSEIMWSWIGAFLGIATVALISYKVLEGKGLTMIIGSFGASAVLIYGAIKSPLAQPRNLLGGHIFSAVIGGESVYKLGYLFAIIPTAVGASIMLIIALLVNNIPRSRRYPEFWL